MNRPLSCYYLDEPLTSGERQFAEESLLGQDAHFATGATSLAEKRIPNILPIPGENGLFSSEPTAHITLVKKNLRNAGIRTDSGIQVLFVLPKEISWSTIFQIAIYEETGFHPYTLQRWYYSGDAMERREPRIVDGHGLIEGKNQ